MRNSARTQVARRAAEMMYFDGVKEYLRAKRKAARELGLEVFPNNVEIRSELDLLADEQEGPARLQRLQALRRRALELMEALEGFSPRLIGSVLSGQIRKSSDIDLHTFAYRHQDVGVRLAEAGFDAALEIVQVRKGGEDRDFPHYYVELPEAVADVSVLSPHELRRPQKSSITHRTMDRATPGRVRKLLERTAQE
ncbi:MAG: hypothetical protein HY303_09755 [Candidatus Wallbacteria bacterium]|nr:hypothetical protein [Candidatus Wallbacteria bacterium]